MDFSCGTGKEIPAGPRYVLMDVEAQYYQPQAANAGPVHQHKTGMAVLSFLIVCAAAAIVLQFWTAAFSDDTPAEPRLFIRLLEAEGLGLDDDPWESPAFELAVDVDGRIPKESLFGQRRPIHVVGGGDDDALLRVSYRGKILAWGRVPRFTIDGDMGPCPCACATSVVTVVAKAEGSVVRQEMRDLIRAEQQVFGRAEFDVDGEIPGLDGHLYCKTYLFEDKRTEGPSPCWIQKKSN